MMNCSQDFDFKDLGSNFLSFSYKGKPYLFQSSTFDVFEIDGLAAKLMQKMNNSDIKKLTLQEHKALEEISSLIPNENREKEKNLNAPLVSAISLELNHICNLRCKYCYVFAGDNHILPENSPQQMTWQTAKQVVDFFLKELTIGSSFFIRLFGGEPLLSFPLIKKIVSYVEKNAAFKKIRTEYLLITNGTVLTDEIKSFLNKRNVNLAFSVDGNEERHNKFRPTSTGTGSFQKIEENRKKINKQPVANVVVNKQNLNMFENYLSLLNSGYETINFSFIFTDKHDLQLDVEDFSRLKEEFIKIKDYVWEDLPNRLSTTPLITDIFYRLKNNISRKNYCGAGKSYIGVGMDGSFYPCHRFVGEKNFKLGDPILGIDSSVRKLFLKPHTESRPICNACPVKNVCGGGCGHTNLMYRGSIESPRELFCILKKFEVECALYLVINEGEKDETCKEGKKGKKRDKSKSKEKYQEAA